MRVLLVAEHQGPCRALLGLGSPDGVEISWALGDAARRLPEARPLAPAALPEDWSGVDAVIRGTSETPGESNLEDAAAEAAARRGLPVYAIEDYPLNYRARPAESLRGLFVEFEEARRRHEARGFDPAKIHVTGNPRYVHMSSAPPGGEAVLWAGQPDAELSFGTLEAVLPVLKRLKTLLIFRAHPRDRFFLTGRYRDLLDGSGLEWEDVTAAPAMDSIFPRCRLVLTQYSTAALEGQCGGVPALFVLLPGLGEESIRRFKGHDWLPWEDAGAAFVVRRESDLESALKSGLYDTIRRDSVLRNFAELVDFNRAASDRIWDLVRRQTFRPATSR